MTVPPLVDEEKILRDSPTMAPSNGEGSFSYDSADYEAALILMEFSRQAQMDPKAPCATATNLGKPSMMAQVEDSTSTTNAVTEKGQERSREDKLRQKRREFQEIELTEEEKTIRTRGRNGENGRSSRRTAKALDNLLAKKNGYC